MDRLIEAIRALPRDEQRHLLELLADDLRRPEAKNLEAKSSLIGLLGDEPELAETIAEEAMRARERDPLRQRGA